MSYHELARKWQKTIYYSKFINRRTWADLMALGHIKDIPRRQYPTEYSHTLELPRPPVDMHGRQVVVLMIPQVLPAGSLLSQTTTWRLNNALFPREYLTPRLPCSQQVNSFNILHLTAYVTMVLPYPESYKAIQDLFQRNIVASFMFVMDSISMNE